MRPGDVVDGRYRLERLLGRGGMGAVFAAHHLMLETQVALKFLVDAPSPEAVARFAREAQVTAKLTSAHATRVMDVVTPADGPPYLVMELLEGKDLDALLEAEGALPLERAVGYVLQACDAIVEAHRRGVIHRDIKPGNLFLARQPEGADVVKVVDFGLSKLMDPAGAPNVSTTTTILGSPAYMSPEQLRSPKLVDARSDVWALGVVLYELLTKQLPFRFETTGELLIAAATEPHVPIRERSPGLPPEIELVFERCFAKKPDERFASVLELARALVPFAAARDRRRVEVIERRESLVVPTPTLSTRPTATAGATTLDAVAMTTRFSRRRARAGLVIAAGFLFIGVTAFVFIDRGAAPEGIPVPLAHDPIVDAALAAPEAALPSATLPRPTSPKPRPAKTR